MRVLTFDEFAAENGASRQSIGEAGLHNPAGHMPKSTWRRMIHAQALKDNEIMARRDQLRIEFNAAVESGEIREPTYVETLVRNAAGHPDKASTQSAQRILARIRASQSAA